jgi:hypothetical protein
LSVELLPRQTEQDVVIVFAVEEDLSPAPTFLHETELVV